MATLHSDQTYPGSVADVFAMLTDPAFMEADAHNVKAVAAHAESHPDGDGVATSITSKVPTGRAPKLVAKFLPAEVEIVESTRWSRVGPDGWDSVVTVSIMGGKGTMSGHGHLTAAGETSTRYEVKGYVTVKVPLVGGAVADQARGLLEGALKHRCQLATEWLNKDL